MTPRHLLTARTTTAADLLGAPIALRHLVAAQDGVATRRQLADCGFTYAQVAAQIAARRWRAIGRHVVVMTNAALTSSQQAWVAVLLLDKPCALAGASAAARAGLVGFEPERVHIVVAHGTHVALPSWVKVHESRRFNVLDVSHKGGPPRTRAARSIIDAAAWSPFPRRACALLCAGVQQRVVTASGLGEQLSSAGRVRHAQIMREILGDISGGGHTLAEIEFGPLARRAGWPPPRRQVLRREPNGRIRYLDIELDLPDGRQVAVEIDGAVHLRPAAAWDDMDRQNEVVIGGRPMLRFASITVRLDPARVIDQLVRFRLRHL